MSNHSFFGLLALTAIFGLIAVYAPSDKIQDAAAFFGGTGLGVLAVNLDVLTRK